MSYTKTNYQDTESKGGLHFMRDPLDAQKQGFSVLETDEGWEGMEHDHEEQDHEEIYFLIEGEAVMTVDGEDVHLEEGDALRVAPEATRELHTPEPSTLVIAGAP
jgi:mannose-6-phosphate isomerase-like protein (cupin superfamily)